MEEGGDDGGDEQRRDSRYILTGRPTGIADRVDLGLKRSGIQGPCLSPFGLP